MNKYLFNRLKVGDKVRINKKGIESYCDFHENEGIVIGIGQYAENCFVDIKTSHNKLVFFPDEIEYKL